MYIIMHIYLYFYMCVCRMRQGKKTSELKELLAETRKRLREGSSRSGMTALGVAVGASADGSL